MKLIFDLLPSGHVQIVQTPYTGPMLTMGRYSVLSVITGTFRLDGGAMFGVVPKVLWSKCAPPDEENRVSLATRTLILIDQAAGRIILTDTGCGTKWRPENAARFAIEHNDAAISRALQAVGASELEVTDIIVTHLHFDHNGGITKWDGDTRERAVPRYPQARHWMHRRQWDHAHHPTPKDKASYFVEDYEAVGQAGLFEFLEGDDPSSPFPDVSWFVSKGHTPYQLLPVVEGDGARLVFMGDVFPTAQHLRPPWVMAYDLYPLTTIAEKELLLNMCITGGSLLAFPHDVGSGIVRVGGSMDKPVVQETLEG